MDILRKYLDKKYINRSFWITLILTYIVPSSEPGSYGFPYKYIRFTTNSYNDTLLSSSEFLILNFLINVCIIFISINLFAIFLDWLRKKLNNSCI